MEKFNNIYIKGTVSELESLLVEIRDNLPEKWVYKETYTRNYTAHYGEFETKIICVESPKINHIQGLIWLRIYKGDLTVINIVPIKPGNLEYAEYNTILDAFYKECILPHAVKKSVKIEYHDAGIDVISLAGSETFIAMNNWEALCNNSTGNTHPSDFERWVEFVVIAHKNNSKLTAEIFGRWLTEEKGWNGEMDITLRLILEYEYSRKLLEEYDKYS